jgi:hypothetical protein
LNIVFAAIGHEFNPFSNSRLGDFELIDTKVDTKGLAFNNRISLITATENRFAMPLENEGRR